MLALYELWDDGLPTAVGFNLSLKKKLEPFEVSKGDSAESTVILCGIKDTARS